MSNLLRSAISARIAKLPSDIPGGIPYTKHPGALSEHDEDEDDGDEESESADSLGHLPGSGMGPPAMSRLHPRTTGRARRTPNASYAPISAEGYFEQAVQVAVPSREMDCRVYYTPPKPRATSEDSDDHTDTSTTTTMVCHHGAGYSGLSFACFAKEVSEMSQGECGVLAMDARRHGRTTSPDAPDSDLSVDVLVADFSAVIQAVYPDPRKAPSLLLVGHSMGGSVVTRSCPVLLSLKYRVAGVAVLDVVEGSAIDALPHMHSLLNARPDGFDSVEEAVEWHVNTKTIHNARSARVSVPSIVRKEEGGPHAYVWRTTLRSTAPYWMSWFQGLSKSFLSARTARILILAGTDRLDKELMIGQMQGKFQMVVVPGVGHVLHEDDPTKLAEILVEFWRRNERVVKGVKRVGDA